MASTQQRHQKTKHNVTKKYLERPLKEAVRALPEFPELPLARIHLIETEEQAQAAREHCLAAGHVGFDTESKPTFFANQAHTGPHLLQLATATDAYLFKPDGAGAEVLKELLSTPALLKVGFGLSSDRGPIQRRLGVVLAPTVDLALATKRLGFKQQVGLRMAVAVVLEQHLRKSKRVATSNWAAARLSPAQLRYAANDAYASRCVYDRLLATAPQVLEERRLRDSS